MKRYAVTATALAVVVAFAGCSMTPPGGEPTEGELGTIDTSATIVGDDLKLTSEQEAAVSEAADGQLIGIVCATMATDYHRELCEGAEARAEALGFTAEIFDAQEDPSRELQGVESFISKGAVAILDDSLGGDAITAQIEQAMDRGIAVVQLASRTFSDSGAITVAVDNITIAEAAGTAAGEYAAANYAGAEVLTALLDYPDIPVLVERADAIEAAMLAAHPETVVVGRFLGGTADNGQASLETALQAHPGIQAVVGINDAGNLGAYQALVSSGGDLADVFMFGIDCDPQAVELIDSDTVYKGCVNTNPLGTGELGVDAFALLFIGETVPATIEVPVFVYTGQ